MACLGPESVSTESYASAESLEQLPKIARCRLADRADLPRILPLVRCRTLDVYPDAERFGDIYEKACLSLVQENENEEVVSAIFLCNYPNVPALSQGDWLTWIHRLYNVKKATEMNTLFIHFLVWDERYQLIFLAELLKSTFYTATFCNYVIMVQPPRMPAAEPVNNTMRKIGPKNEASEVEAQTIHLVSDDQFIPALTYRLAVEEDNDDIVNLFDAECGALRSRYGDYYVSEMMRHPLGSRQLCVAERPTGIAAVLCISADLDLDLLNATFDLSSLGLLRKAIPSAEPSEDEGEEEEHVSYEPCADGQDESECPVRRRSSVKKRKSLPEEQPTDAFAIELLGFASKIDELDSRGLLSAGFDCFPDLDHCVMLVPSEHGRISFLSQFTRMPLKADQDFPMALYVAHRLSVQGSFRTRRAYPSDYVAVARLVEGMLDAPYILHDFTETFDKDEDCEQRSFILVSGDNVVALAVVCSEQESKLLCRCFRVDTISAKAPVNAAYLLRLVIVPVIQPRLGLFLNEVLCLMHCDILFRRTRSEATDLALTGMWPLEPRIRNWPQFQHYHRKDYPDSPFEQLFSLHATVPKLALKSKRIIDAKIVVVGESNCGLAFIDALALGYKYRELQFGDITLISKNGLSFTHSRDYGVRLMTPFQGRYCQAYRYLTSAKASYNVIVGTVVAIDRREKCVRVEGSGIITYDYLVITTGMQFQLPDFVPLLDDGEEAGFSSERNSLRFSSTYKWHPNIPLKAFTVNDDYEAKRCLEEIVTVTDGFTIEKSIVFVGNCLECYCALAACIELGLPGHWITLITTYMEFGDGFDDVPEIRAFCADWAEDHGVSVVRHIERIEPVQLATDGSMRLVLNAEEQEELECDVLVCYQVKSPSLKTFQAITHSGLVFDGHLVIDNEFRTNDECVFAAGTISRHTRKPQPISPSPICHNPQHLHNSIEVGEKLAAKFVDMLTEKDDEEKSKESLLPKMPDCSYRRPIVTASLLPGGYRFLRIRSPGKQVSTAQAAERGDLLITGDITSDVGYFNLELGQFGVVESIMCIRRKDFAIQNLVALYGKHEAMLGDLKTRYQNNEIPDFFEYFEQPWMSAIFHDRFDDVRKECQDTILNSALRNSSSQLSLKTGLLTDDNAEQLEEILTSWQQDGYEPPEMQDSVAGFIERHEDDLPMYLTERKKSLLLTEIEALTVYPVTRDSDTRSESNAGSSDPRTSYVRSSCPCSDYADSATSMSASLPACTGV